MESHHQSLERSKLFRWERNIILRERNKISPEQINNIISSQLTFRWNEFIHYIVGSKQHFLEMNGNEIISLFCLPIFNILFSHFQCFVNLLPIFCLPVPFNGSVVESVRIKNKINNIIKKTKSLQGLCFIDVVSPF